MSIPLVLSDEQEELQRSVRRFLAERAPMAEVRRLMDPEETYDPELWRRMAEELGLQGLGIPEVHGGSGAGPVELGLVFEEMGRALTCAPFFATVALAAPTLMASGDGSVGAELLEGIAAGTTIATVALVGKDDLWTPEGVTIAAVVDGDGHRVTGTRSFVIDGDSADVILVVADFGGGPTLFAVEGGAQGVSRRRLEALDFTRRLAEVEFSSVPARQIGAAGRGWDYVSEGLEFATIALAAESSGGAQQCLDMATEYARNRVQFGRIIGSFQAIKHLCADMLVSVEGAKASASYAAWAAAENWADREQSASVARVFCAEAFFSVSAENIQVHGGIGFTWEHDAHLYFRRAKSSDLMLGGPRHRQLLERHIGLVDA